MKDKARQGIAFTFRRKGQERSGKVRTGQDWARTGPGLVRERSGKAQRKDKQRQKNDKKSKLFTFSCVSFLVLLFLEPPFPSLSPLAWEKQPFLAFPCLSLCLPNSLRFLAFPPDQSPKRERDTHTHTQRERERERERWRD